MKFTLSGVCCVSSGSVALVEPMLAGSRPLPRGHYAYELKCDGFRALVSTVGRLRVLSRQWWEMTPHLPELQALPRGVALDGELIAFGDDGKPSFPRLCQRMLHGHDEIPIMFIAFDILHARGEATLRLPYRRRREILEALDFRGDHWSAVFIAPTGRNASVTTAPAGATG